MPRIISLAQYRQPPKRVFFSRRELNLLLSLYSRRVMNGEWRDYAIDHDNGMAVFSVFRHSYDRPIHAIAKRPGRRGTPPYFVLLSGQRAVKRSDSLDELLDGYFNASRSE